MDICEGVAFPNGLLASSETRDDDTKQEEMAEKSAILSFILLTKWPLEGEKSQYQVSHCVTLC